MGGGGWCLCEEREDVFRCLWEGGVWCSCEERDDVLRCLWEGGGWVPRGLGVLIGGWRYSCEGGRKEDMCGFPSEGVCMGGWRYSCEERTCLGAYGRVEVERMLYVDADGIVGEGEGEVPMGGAYGSRK